MRIAELISAGDQFLSLEFFPPKEKADWPAFFQVVDRLTSINPLFASVTYGAGGTTQESTLEIVTRLKREFNLEPMAHLTCVGASKEGIQSFVDSLVEAGIDNLLALRGDPPQDQQNSPPLASDFEYASDLVSFLRKENGRIGIGVAGYPEVHPQASSPEADLEFLKLKLDLGADFAVTQLFFDNLYYWDFLKRARNIGITKPLIPGIMPVFNLKVVQRILTLCGTCVPHSFMKQLEEAQAKGGSAAVQELGIEHARKQIQELLDKGVPGVHLYTLNKDDACLDLISRLNLAHNG
ncbi:MAG: methylenetetrahydrofolate reductase [NAD(P)H] [Deltaproteobacteria bacterium]